MEKRTAAGQWGILGEEKERLERASQDEALRHRAPCGGHTSRGW